MKGFKILLSLLLITILLSCDISSFIISDQIIKYQGNGNTTGVPPVSIKKQKGETVTVATSESLEKTGYTFLEWNTKADGSGTSYNPGDTFLMGVSDITLYAIWDTGEFTVSYDGNDNTGGSIPASLAYDYQDIVSVAHPGSLEKNGHTFSMWNTESGASGNSYDPGDTFLMSDQNITLYAIWDLGEFTVTYNGNGNSSGIAPGAVVYDYQETITVADSGNLEKTGYTFLEWNTKIDGSGISYNSGDTFLMGSENILLFAQWKFELWAKSTSLSSNSSIFYDLAIDNKNNTYAVGNQNGSNSFSYGDSALATGPHYNSNSVIVKYTSEGKAEWARSIFSSQENSVFYSVAVDITGNAYVVGWQYRNGNFSYGNGVNISGPGNNSNPVIVKYNSYGDTLWAKTLSSGYSGSFTSIAIDLNGNIYVAGSQGKYLHDYNNEVTAYSPSNGANAVLVKYDSDGNAIWARSIIEGDGGSAFLAICLDEQGNIYTCGAQSSTNPFNYGMEVLATGSSMDSNSVIVKYNPLGETQWARSVSIGSESSSYYSIASDHEGFIYAAGIQKGTQIFAYGPSVTAVGTNGLDSPVVVKYNANSGEAIWAKVAIKEPGFSDDTSYTGIKISNSGYIYLTGYISSVETFTFSNEVSLTGKFGVKSTPFIVKYNKHGTAEKVDTFLSGTDGVIYNSIDIDDNGYLYTAGYQSGTSEFQYSPQVWAIGSYSGGNAVVVKHLP